GAAGALTLANTLFIQPQPIFGVQWTAYMIFMVLVGGLGTFEGPLVGAVVFFAIQHWFADLGAWYLIGLGATAIAFALLLPRGVSVAGSGTASIWGCSRWATGWSRARRTRPGDADPLLRRRQDLVGALGEQVVAELAAEQLGIGYGAGELGAQDRASVGHAAQA